MAKSNEHEEVIKACKSIAETEGKDTHKLAAHIWELSLRYMGDVRARAARSFYSALAIAIVGLIFFFTALGLMLAGSLPFSRLTLIAGMSIQVVSAMGFYLHGKTTKEFFAFHVCLERANRFLLANTICENLGEPAKDKIRSKLVLLIASAPALSTSLVERGESADDNLEIKPSDEPSNERVSETIIKDLPLTVSSN